MLGIEDRDVLGSLKLDPVVHDVPMQFSEAVDHVWGAVLGSGHHFSLESVALRPDVFSSQEREGEVLPQSVGDERVFSVVLSPEETSKSVFGSDLREHGLAVVEAVRLQENIVSTLNSVDMSTL